MSIKFIHESDGFDGLNVTVEIPTGVDIWEITEAYKQFLLAVSYHPDTVKKVFPEEEE